jgi:single-strand DNA-binding protein
VFLGGVVRSNLNSVLIEGRLIESPVEAGLPGGKFCSFKLESSRFSKRGGDSHRSVSYFDVKAEGDVGKQCLSVGYAGAGVRVVGHLEQERWLSSGGVPQSRIVLVADHVSFGDGGSVSEPADSV